MASGKPGGAADKLTPMMQQYRRVKSQIPRDALLLFRLGDFYEMFFDDAKTGAGLLNLALTHRNQVPMCGIPHHAAESYIGRLLRAGRKVAICDQLEEPRPGKLVERDVTQILSPGTHFDARLLHAERNNFLAALCPGQVPEGLSARVPESDATRRGTGKPAFGLALIDLTTGEFQVAELATVEQLQSELARVRPAEMIVPAEWVDEAKRLLAVSGTQALGHSGTQSLTPYDGWTFEPETAFFTLRDHFQTQSLDGFGAGELTVGVGAAGAALHYLAQSLRRSVAHIHRLSVSGVADHLVLDAVTQRNLELLESPRSDRAHSLLGCTDRTRTPMGARLLREWLTRPLRDVAAIRARQEVIAWFLESPGTLADFRDQLGAVRDLERTLGRLSVGGGNARDLVALKESLAALPQLRRTLGGAAAGGSGEAVHDATGPYHASPRAARLPWGGFPEVIVSCDLRAAQSHPEYRAAKEGDADAAYRFVRGILEEEAVSALRSLVGDRRPILVAAHAVEAEGRRNAIPEMYAKVLGDRLGLPVDAGIVQSNVVQHTGAGAFHLIAYQPVFAGPVQSGQDYLLVDDNVAVGGTLANLRGYIETRGGRVIGATTLTESGPSGRIAVRPGTLEALRAKHGNDLETWWHEQFGYGLDCLTESEARHLHKAPDVDAVRDRVAAARQAADPPPGGPADRLRETGDIEPAVPPGFDSPFLQSFPAPALLAQLLAKVTEQPALQELIGRAIVDAPPADLKDGGLIKEGFHPELDVLRRASTEGKQWIAALQQQEIERTGISSLKVRYNQVFGYYIEITRSNLAKVPAEYIRKQTIAGGERFITPELKEMEGKILGADEKAAALEYELFLQVRGAVVAESAAIQATAGALAALDVLAGLAELARHQNWCRPEVTDGARIEIVDGRHPVLEQTLVEERFVPNDVVLDDREHQVLIITGPNMAGKSTYIRQVALLVLLAQTGSYIPAARASVSVVDRIFTRVGATDDLARGQSTFLVEMNETANILNNATPKSLIILDEIGRGTSTFDGLSIAWAVAEHLHNEVGAKTLFATHYHELTELAATLPRVKNFNVAVREWHDQVVFLHKILPGGTDKSYGIQVARLAGLPKPVVARAKEVLGNLEEAELSADGKPKLAGTRRKKSAVSSQQSEVRGQQSVGRGQPRSAWGKPSAAREPPPQMNLFGERKG